MRRASIVLALLLAALAGYGQLLSPQRIVASPYSDLFAYHLAAKDALHQALHDDAGVLWREDHLSGQPGLTHPQASWGNPLHALFWLLPPEQAVGPTYFALFVLTAIGFWLAAGALGLGGAARLLAGACGLFQLKLILAAYAGWLGVLPSLALLPWLFWALVLALRQPGLAAAVRLALVATLLLHCGQLQIGYYAALVALAWSGGYVLGQRDGATRRRLATLFAAALVAVAAAAWLLVPLALEAPLLTRAHATWPFFIGRHAVAPRHLLTLLRPEILGTPWDRSYPDVELWEDEAYFGLVPLAGCVAAVLLARRRPWFRALAASLLLPLAVGFNSPLLRAAFVALPGFRLFRCPSRLLFVCALFGILLGALGFDALSARLTPVWRRALLAVALILVAGEGIYDARRYLPTEPIATALPPSTLAARIAAEPGRFRTALVAFPPRAIWPVRPAALRQVGGFDTYASFGYREYFERMRRGAAPANLQAGGWFELDRVTRWELLDQLAVRFVVTPKSVTLPADRFELVGSYEHEACFVHYNGIANAHLRLWRNRFAGPFREVWHPGWRATVGGVAAPSAAWDGALLDAPAGAQLTFRPLGWPLAPIVSLSALVLLIAAAIGIWRANRQ